MTMTDNGNGATLPELEQHKVETMSVDVARQLIAAQRTERVNACETEINEVLGRHGCKMTVAVIIEPPNRVTPIVRIVADD